MQCLGPSMLPTFNIKGDVVLINRLAGRVFPYQVGDIVICKSPSNPNLNICKRVMGLVSLTQKYDLLIFELHLISLADLISNSLRNTKALSTTLHKVL